MLMCDYVVVSCEDSCELILWYAFSVILVYGCAFSQFSSATLFFGSYSYYSVSVMVVGD